MDETLSQAQYRLAAFGSYQRLSLPDRPASAKTGTSGSGYDNYDNWTVGWTPNLLTTVWVGDPQGESATYGLTPGVTSGVTGAAPIWQTYMEGATANTPLVWYQTPSDVYEAGGSWYLPGTGPDSSMGNGRPICAPNCFGEPTTSDTPFSQPYQTPSHTAVPTAAPTAVATPAPSPSAAGT
jgi:penicillin-binding protein 1A